MYITIIDGIRSKTGHANLLILLQFLPYILSEVKKVQTYFFNHNSRLSSRQISFPVASLYNTVCAYIKLTRLNKHV